jgi:hypothetical protein
VSDLDPAQASSLDDLASCLRQLHLRADRPSYRVLQDQTRLATGLLPRTKIRRVRLRRSTISDVLQGETFPSKSFLLTFVEACGVDLKADQRWEQAWDRLALVYQGKNRETSVRQLLRQIEDLRQQLAAVERGGGNAFPQGSDDGEGGQTVSGQVSLVVTSDQETAQDSRSQRIRLLMDVVRAAQSLPVGPQKASIQTNLALAMSVNDLNWAERIARSITSEEGSVFALANIGQAMAMRAAWLTARAERVASSVAGEERKALALASLAQAMATVDPGRAERIARSITIEDWKALALASLAQAMATADPGRAERIARSITIEDRKTPALASLAQAMATADPERAERIARSIIVEDCKALTLANVARATAAIDPGRATRLANDAEITASLIENTYAQASVLATIARVLAATDPGRAERIARSIGPASYKALALGGIAQTVAVTDPGRVGQLISDALEFAESITWRQPKVSTLATLAQDIAAIDPDRAEHIARSLTRTQKTLGLASIAQTVAATDPARASRLARDAELAARSITREAERASALAKIAQAIASTDPSHATELISEVVGVIRSITRAEDKESALVDLAQAIATLAPYEGK